MYVSSTNSIQLRYTDVSKDQHSFIIEDPIVAACFVSYSAILMLHMTV